MTDTGFNLSIAATEAIVGRIGAVYLQTLQDYEVRVYIKNALYILTNITSISDSNKLLATNSEDKEVIMKTDLLEAQYPGISNKVDLYNVNNRADIFKFSDDPPGLFNQTYTAVIHPIDCSFRILFGKSFTEPITDITDEFSIIDNEYVPNQSPESGYYVYPLTDAKFNYTTEPTHTVYHTGLLRIGTRFYPIDNYHKVTIADSNNRGLMMPIALYLPIGTGKSYGRYSGSPLEVEQGGPPVSLYPIHIIDTTYMLRVFLINKFIMLTRDSNYLKFPFEYRNDTPGNAFYPYLDDVIEGSLVIAGNSTPVTIDFPPSLPSADFDHEDVIIPSYTKSVIKYDFPAVLKEIFYFSIKHRDAKNSYHTALFSVDGVTYPPSQNLYEKYFITHRDLPLIPDFTIPYPDLNPNNLISAFLLNDINGNVMFDRSVVVGEGDHLISLSVPSMPLSSSYVEPILSIKTLRFLPNTDPLYTYPVANFTYEPPRYSTSGNEFAPLTVDGAFGGQVGGGSAYYPAFYLEEVVLDELIYSFPVFGDVASARSLLNGEPHLFFPNLNSIAASNRDNRLNFMSLISVPDPLGKAMILSVPSKLYKRVPNFLSNGVFGIYGYSDLNGDFVPYISRFGEFGLGPVNDDFYIVGGGHDSAASNYRSRYHANLFIPPDKFPEIYWAIRNYGSPGQNGGIEAAFKMIERLYGVQGYYDFINFFRIVNNRAHTVIDQMTTKVLYRKDDSVPPIIPFFDTGLLLEYNPLYWHFLDRHGIATAWNLYNTTYSRNIGLYFNSISTLTLAIQMIWENAGLQGLIEWLIWNKGLLFCISYLENTIFIGNHIGAYVYDYRTLSEI